MRYSHGRIAWWPEAFSMPYFALVDDLRTRTRRAYEAPGLSGHGYKTALGDKLFILGNGTTMHVWHLQLDRLHTLELPESFERSIAEGENVLIVFKSSAVSLWSFGEPSPRPVDMTKLPCYPKEPLNCNRLYKGTGWRKESHFLRQGGLFVDFILSPTDRDRFFVITVRHDWMGLLTVYEISNHVLLASYTMAVSGVIEPMPDNDYLRWEKVDSYGGYSLVHAVTSKEAPGATGEGLICSCADYALYKLVSLEFNIYSKTFRTRYYQYEDHDGETYPAYQIWNDRFIHHDSESCLLRSELPLNWEGSCRHTEEAMCKLPYIPVYATSRGKVPFIAQRRRVALETSKPPASLVNLESALYLDRDYTEVNASSATKIFGDDDFLILVPSQEYTAFSFGEDIPDTKPEADEPRSSWRLLHRKK
ncbi:hypothetical protein GGR56DRAFT_502010 [Xylariaceae sp. FL0804]|nr:hypothetical protein GGR56DRAFT_502010 [Xylariaceae sp. FL0804]